MFKAVRLLQIFLLTLVLVILVTPAMAQEGSDGTAVGVTDDEVNEVARDVYCPVCENTPLDVCQTKACADWRELIRTKLAEGQTREEIFDYFARQYGDGVLANPPRRGVSLVMLWVLPVVLILLGLLLFSRYMRGLKTAEPAGTAALYNQGSAMDSPSKKSEPAADDYMARVEEELKNTDE
jgi:cytochrome c-type biogenesis protein CcmH